jgi:hypothetical protein
MSIEIRMLALVLDPTGTLLGAIEADRPLRNLPGRSIVFLAVNLGARPAS